MPTNVLGGELQSCCREPMTGFYRDGMCRTGANDLGQHTVCAMMTGSFLEFSASRGNDLRTPVPENGFPGLEDGDRWCLCVERWKETLEAGCEPPVGAFAVRLYSAYFASFSCALIRVRAKICVRVSLL